MNKTVIALSFLTLLSAYGVAHAEDAASGVVSNSGGAAAVPVATPAPAENVAPAPAPALAPQPAEHLTPEQRVMKNEQKPIEGVLPTDPPEVVELKAKAGNGDVSAQHELGVLYGEGQGSVSRDYKEALKWHRMAADNADPDSEHYMGFSYENGIGGVTRSDVAAAEWYLKAAKQGHAVSQGIIGSMYASGKGVDQDYQQAYIWLTLAKRGGDEYYAGQIDSVKKHIPAKYWRRIDGVIDAWKPEKGEKGLTSGGGKIDFGD